MQELLVSGSAERLVGEHTGRSVSGRRRGDALHTGRKASPSLTLGVPFVPVNVRLWRFCQFVLGATFDGQRPWEARADPVAGAGPETRGRDGVQSDFSAEKRASDGGCDVSVIPVQKRML